MHGLHRLSSGPPSTPMACSMAPTADPTLTPTYHPSTDPSNAPSFSPTTEPTADPTTSPTAHVILVKTNAAFSATHYLTNYIFSPPYNGTIIGIKLVHKTGSVTCDHYNYHYTNWGCHHQWDALYVSMIKHNANANELYYPTPTTQGLRSPNWISCPNGCNVLRYALDNYGLNDDSIELIDYSKPYNVSISDAFSIQYSEGCCQTSTYDNDGTVYADVYFLYQTYEPTKDPTASPSSSSTMIS